ncbi:2-amino-4-hydroxy-6-hydroxymethyldihydropteridine diphosphokinase [Leucothrix sargassi]|nr:2-amino-4-hydroxy-6-hydroxymethyldihydropteridine diphosphokinase [Leucothrix sargassi]
MTWVQCYIGLGSNLGASQDTLIAALAALEAHEAIKQIEVSSYYQSKPHGPQDQPDYLNAVAGFQTTLAPEPLLDVLQAIENEQGRVRTGERWTARTLDLDLLLYANDTINTPRLIVPHPWMTRREFVLYPLYELAPNLSLPDGSSLESYLADVSDKDLVRQPSRT